MFHSSDLQYLRADVRVNCETFLVLCKEAGLNVKVTETVRDDEYQRYLAANGYAAKTATVPTFHSVKAGLAFDICKNVKGHEYDDLAFFDKCGFLLFRTSIIFNKRIDFIISSKRRRTSQSIGSCLDIL